MKKLMYLLFGSGICLTACEKSGQEIPADTVTEATFSRSIHLQEQGIKKDMEYTVSDNINYGAGFTDSIPTANGSNMFYLFIQGNSSVDLSKNKSVSFNPIPSVTGSFAEGISFLIDRNKLKPGYVGIYDLSSNASLPVWKTQYSYSYLGTEGLKSNISDSKTGLIFRGQVTIEKYDRLQNCISGTYSAVHNLNSDPTKFNMLIDPLDRCEVVLRGTFTNVKIRSN
jgi:hypothetical protein